MSHLKLLFSEVDKKSFEAVNQLQKKVSSCFQESKYEQAISLILKSILIMQSLQVKQVLKNQEVQLRSLLGLAYFNQQNSLEKALWQFDRCSMLDPINPLLLRRRGQVYFKAKDYQEALKNYQEYCSFCPDDGEILKLIKQIQTALKVDLKKIEHSAGSTNSLVRFGSFEVIEITREVSDEADARIHKGVVVLTQKSKKSILKDSSSVASYNTDENKISSGHQFDSSKLKAIDKISKKDEDQQDESKNLSQLDIIPLKKAKSLFEKEQKDEDMEKCVDIQISSAKLKRKSSLKKSKSVAWRATEQQKDDT